MAENEPEEKTTTTATNTTLLATCPIPALNLNKG